ncbi:phosphopantothenoylcysteine decarboxylase domain-containing protein [Helicobacter sp. T3_23-1059]
MSKENPDTHPLYKVNILLCVSGSIAAFKALELLSGLKKLGANIAVVMSKGAKRFISPLSFEALSHNEVLHKDTESWVDLAKNNIDFSDINPSDTKSSVFDFNKPKSINHIQYAKWADIVIIAPATANTISKIAYGIADNLITQTLLAINKNETKILLAPAMNTQMFDSHQVQNALKILQDFGVEIIPPKKALLACNTYGVGALAEVEEMIFRTLRASFEIASFEARFCNDISQSGFGQKNHLWQNNNFWQECNFWKSREVIITGGGASAQIDSVRAISNYSSGKQAIALAKAAYTLGAKVTLISSKIDGFLPQEIQCLSANNNDDYKSAIDSCLQTIDSSNAKSSDQKSPKNKTLKSKKPVLFMAAALCDYAPKSPKNYKIKKSTLPNLTLDLCATQDILASIDSNKIYKIGFKAESIDKKNTLQDAITNAKKMLLPSKKGGKECACVCLNVLENDAKNGKDFSPFGADFNSFYLLDSRALASKQDIEFLGKKSKLAISYQILSFVRASIKSTKS